MATTLENLQTTYENVAAQLATYSAAIATSGGDIDSYSIEGQSVSKLNVFKKMESLYAQLEQLKRLIAIESGSYQVHSYGVPW